MSKYIYNYSDWPDFYYDSQIVMKALLPVKFQQGVVKGYLKSVGFVLRDTTALEALTSEVVKSSEIEGEKLDLELVRSSIARRLGLEFGGIITTDRYIDGIVEMALDATQNYKKKLTEKRLGNWQAALFPTGRSGAHKITVGKYRNGKLGPMQIVSGVIGKEKVHFEAPNADQVPVEMKKFLVWFNSNSALDPVIKAAIAHLWFVTIHPFADGNGRITRAITDMMLTRCDEFPQRFYSMSAEIRNQRKQYYEILENTQSGSLDITEWIVWFLKCLKAALDTSEKKLKNVMEKSHFWDQHSKTEFNERQRKIINKLFDGFDGKLNSSKWGKICNCSTDTALRDIQDLMSKTILKKEEGGGRSTSYSLVMNAN
jgi:Fic family protein